MKLNDALSLVGENCWKATCVPLSNVGAVVVSDTEGNLRVFDGGNTVSLEAFVRQNPDVWREAEQAEWGIAI